MRVIPILFVLALTVGACGGSNDPVGSSTTIAIAASTSTVAPSSTTSTSTTTTSTVAPTTTTSLLARAPAIEFWDAWTLILASIEIEPGSIEEAFEIAEGVEDAHVVWSDEVPSLNPDYWVVYWGEFESGDEASTWCSSLPEELTCYPRYIGNAVSPLAADGNALVVDEQSLQVVDVMTGEELKTFDPYFQGDGTGIGRMALTPDASALYYTLGWEDSWYSCEASQGQVWKLDLAFGTRTEVTPGYGPTVSPDGRWMAVLLAEQCLPDPAQPDIWVMTPTDTIVLFDLLDGWPREMARWSVGTAPTSYNDPQMLTWIDWRANSEALVVTNNSGSLFELTLDHSGPIDTGPPLAEFVLGYPQALIGNTLYVLRDETPEAFEAIDLVAIDLAAGSDSEVLISTDWWPAVSADTTRTRLIWGAESTVYTTSSSFTIDGFLGALAW